MDWTAFDTWIVITGVLCAMACALPGNFLVLRRMSMMGDAISHAVLPGLAAAFLITGARQSFTMFIGAAIVGVLTALFTQWVHRFGQVDRGAAMGVVFTTLFAVGLILLEAAPHDVDLDAGCVLYGAIEYVPLYKWSVFGMEMPQATLVLAGVLLVNVLFVAMLYKELKISSFDPDLATTLGINADVMQYLLMTIVAVTTVAAFESIGSILVIAMLIVPASAAHLLTDRLGPMIGVSMVFAALSAALGYLATRSVTLLGLGETTAAGMMATVAGVMFVVVMLLAPRHGVISRVLRRVRLGVRIVREDILGMLYRLEEVGRARTADLGGLIRDALEIGPVTAALALGSLRRGGLVRRDGDAYTLTDDGRATAAQLVRTHRLWEVYLAEHLNLPLDHLHAPAHRLEHLDDQSVQRELAAEVEQRVDPHGREIPPGGG